ncbi:hypothetical protein MHAEM_21341 [Mycolicibacterium phlei]|nr:hypothetical protein [Mycolicibacterium phlei]
MKNLIAQAHQIVDMAWEKHGENRKLAATCILFSGGNDSTALAHMMKGRADYAIHCNTTIGIEQTRQFVRDTCKAWGLPLLEMFPPKTYRELVTDPKNGGFPGPAMHFKMYARLKERGLEAARRQLVKNPWRERVLYIAGRRRSESKRRANVSLNDRKGSMVFASPLAMWTKIDLNTYRLMMRDTDDPVPVNEVSELLHMSGECLCGSFAKEGELEEIRLWFPEVAAEIDALMEEVRAAGYTGPKAIWGNRAGRPTKKSGMLCSSCEFTDGVENPA